MLPVNFHIPLPVWQATRTVMRAGMLGTLS